MSYFDGEKAFPLTNNREDMIRIGKEISVEKASTYNTRMMEIIRKTIDQMMPDATDTEKENEVYASIYDYWAFGNSVMEEFYFDFPHKSIAEKFGYLTFRNRYLYMNHLNSAETRHFLDVKWDAYNLMKPYYRREAILIKDDSDYTAFREFTERHPRFAVKPVGLGLAKGVHLEDVTGCRTRTVFDKILTERDALHTEYAWGDSTAMMIEELIIQDERMAAFHPSSVQTIRLVAVRVDNNVHIWYPRFHAGQSGSFLSNGATGGIMALVDPISGVIMQKGIDESGNIYETHPDTGVRIVGFRIPRWNELIDMATNLMLNVVKDTRYVGWDVALTPDGWCVVEGNWSGEFMADQISCGHGLRKEFEELIGWKPDVNFWWQASDSNKNK